MEAQFLAAFGVGIISISPLSGSLFVVIVVDGVRCNIIQGGVIHGALWSKAVCYGLVKA